MGGEYVNRAISKILEIENTPEIQRINADNRSCYHPLQKFTGEWKKFALRSALRTIVLADANKPVNIVLGTIARMSSYRK